MSSQSYHLAYSSDSAILPKPYPNFLDEGNTDKYVSKAVGGRKRKTLKRQTLKRQTLKQRQRGGKSKRKLSSKSKSTRVKTLSIERIEELVKLARNARYGDNH